MIEGRGFPMDNVSIFTASRSTHLKVVVTALAASIAVVVVGIAASRAPVDTATLQTAGVIKASQTMTVTQSGNSTVR
jgi:hypothetical protein